MNFLRKLVDSKLVPLLSHIAARMPPHASLISQTDLARELGEIHRKMAARSSNNPCLKGFKAFSQTDEDGIIEDILLRVSAVVPLSKAFIEIGCGNGVENNTHYLLLKGYRGCWIDGDAQNLQFIKDELGDLEFESLRVQQHFVDLSNIGEIIKEQTEFLRTSDPDFFSLDIDGNDLHVLDESLKHFQPKVICVEYNAKFPPPLAVTIKYNASHVWGGDDYHGASLRAFCDLLKNYRLVCCNVSGVNAFFVRNDLAVKFDSSDDRDLYQPFREYMVGLKPSHSPTLKWLRDKLASDRKRKTPTQFAEERSENFSTRSS